MLILLRVPVKKYALPVLLSFGRVHIYLKTKLAAIIPAFIQFRFEFGETEYLLNSQGIGDR
jgi:hypothetical protein